MKKNLLAPFPCKKKKKSVSPPRLCYRCLVHCSAPSAPNMSRVCAREAGKKKKKKKRNTVCKVGKFAEKTSHCSTQSASSRHKHWLTLCLVPE